MLEDIEKLKEEYRKNQESPEELPNPDLDQGGQPGDGQDGDQGGQSGGQPGVDQNDDDTRGSGDDSGSGAGDDTPGTGQDDDPSGSDGGDDTPGTGQDDDASGSDDGDDTPGDDQDDDQGSDDDDDTPGTGQDDDTSGSDDGDDSSDSDDDDDAPGSDQGDDSSDSDDDDDTPSSSQSGGSSSSDDDDDDQDNDDVLDGRLEVRPVANGQTDLLAGRDYDLFEVEYLNALGQEVEPNRSIEVRLPYDTNKVVDFVAYLGDDFDDYEEIRNFRLEDGYVVFSRDSFSYYAVVYKAKGENQTQANASSKGHSQESVPSKVGGQSSQGQLPNTGATGLSLGLGLSAISLGLGLSRRKDKK